MDVARIAGRKYLLPGNTNLPLVSGRSRGLFEQFNASPAGTEKYRRAQPAPVQVKPTPKPEKPKMPTYRTLPEVSLGNEQPILMAVRAASEYGAEIVQITRLETSEYLMQVSSELPSGVLAYLSLTEVT